MGTFLQSLSEFAPPLDHDWMSGIATFGLAGAAVVTVTLWRKFQNTKSALAELAAAREALRLRETLLTEQAEKNRRTEAALAAAQRSAEESDKSKRDFFAVMSHEIRTPLGGIIGMLDLLRKLPQSPQQQHYTTLARDSADVLLELLDDLLDAAKIEAGRLTLETIPFSPRVELGRVVAGMRARAMAKGLELSCTFEDSVPDFVKGDPIRLRQVLSNLISNALKFTQQGFVRIRIRAERQNGGQLRLCINVVDTGPGIPADLKAKLFSKFEQGDASTSRRFGGTGLGLAIAKHIVEMMFGRISVESRPGQGSDFRFDVALAAVAPEEITTLHREEWSKPMPAHSRALRVLCADDEMINRVIVEGLVTGMGHTVEFAKNGHEAVDLLTRFDFDVLLMDYLMPMLIGIDAARQIRAASIQVRDREIFIAALTANTAPEHRADCTAAGMNGFLSKPIQESELHRLLEQVIEFQLWRGRDLPAVSGADAPHSNRTEPSVDAPGLTENEIFAMIAAADAKLFASKAAPKISVEIARHYLTDAPERLRQMRDAVATGDLTALGIAAHSLKNISHYVDARRLSDLSAEIEKSADSGNVANVERQVSDARAEFEVVKKRLHIFTGIQYENTAC
jgi:signal transduction histidine kinase/DNA-binding NarL/FixJ family response regulator/HPt (histidine-containing phosphotransfer) domain-containing protein